MSYGELYLWGGLVVLIYVTCIWLLSLWKKDAGIMDIFWGLGFVVLALFYGYYGQASYERSCFVIALVGVWGLRLSIYLAMRNLGKAEDYRYLAWREKNGKRWWWYSFFKVFLLQGTVLWIVSAPLLSAQFYPGVPLGNTFDIIAVAFWIVGITFETVGDLQLRKFKKAPDSKGKLLNTGLWAYTRHPNYFGDAMVWWSFYLLSCANGGYATIMSTVVMNFFLMKISGVVMLEKSLKQNKPKYAEYMEKTNAFFPWFPKNSKSEK